LEDDVKRFINSAKENGNFIQLLIHDEHYRREEKEGEREGGKSDREKKK